MSAILKNSTFMNVNKTSNFFRNINNENSTTEKNSKQKVNKIKSELHQDLLWTFRILIMFFKLIGLATFAHRIVIYKKRTSYTFQYSKLGIVYNVVLSGLIIASNYMSMPYRFNLIYKFGYKMHWIVVIRVLLIVLGSLAVCAILISYCINQKCLIRIANRLITIEHGIDHLYDLYRPLRRQRIFCAMFIVCILKICLLILVLFTEILAFHRGPVSWLTNVLPTFHVGWLLIQYFLLVTIIQTDFADVNRAIQNLIRINTPDFRLQFLYQTRHIVDNNSTVHQLLQLRDIHCHLCEISEDVSSFYSLPVLFGIIFLFLKLVFTCCGLFSPLFISDDFYEYETFNIFIGFIIWIMFLIYPISLLTNRITRILIEMEKTGNIVHDLLNRAIEKEIIAELKKFSLQLLHRKVKFTVNGYFTLDNIFFHSLIGTVMTYLIILTQFLMGSLSLLIEQQCNYTGRD